MAKILPKFAKIINSSLDVGQNLPGFCRNFPRTFRSLHAAFRQHSGIGTSSGGRCISPDAPFLAGSCARPAAALRDEVNRRLLLGGRQSVKTRQTVQTLHGVQAQRGKLVGRGALAQSGFELRRGGLRPRDPFERTHAPGRSVRGERENFTWLVLGCTEAKFRKQMPNSK